MKCIILLLLEYAPYITSLNIKYQLRNLLVIFQLYFKLVLMYKMFNHDHFSEMHRSVDIHFLRVNSFY